MRSVSEIFANNFLIQADLVVGEGNKNCNAKFAFKAADGFEAQRLQLRFDFPYNQVFLEKVTGNTIVTSYAKAANLTVSQGEHHLAIEVKGDTITAWLDDQQFTTSTDNLVTITNNRFQLNEKFKEITVTAHFKTREAGKNELFFDDFGGKQEGTLPEGVTIQEGELIMNVPEGKQSSLYQPKVAWEKIPKDSGYRISADVRRTTQKDGTAQIIFRSGKNAEQNYTLLFNTQGSAIFLDTPLSLDRGSVKGDANALHTKDAGMVDLGKAPEVNETKKAITAESGLLDGYKLKPDSVLIDRGITVDEAYKELFEKAKAGNSIDYVMGNNFPKIPNAAYDKDFFAGSNMSGKKPDIGAAEYKETEKP